MRLYSYKPRIGAPDVPRNVAITNVTDTSMTISWTANTESDFASYNLYRSTTGSNYGLPYVSGLTSPTYQDTGLTASTLYYYKVTCEDTAGNESGFSSVVSQETTTAPTGLTWTPDQNPLPVPLPSFTYGIPGTFDFDPYISGTPGSITVETGALPPNVTIVGQTLSYDGGGSPSGHTETGVSFRLNTSAESDWQSRISGSGVVWYHDFRNAAEVDAFRWTGGYGSGNDPNSVGSNSQYVTRQADGPTGWCLEIQWPSAGQFGNSHWWRPMAPLVGTGNGRGQNDPAANGTLTVRPYAPTNGGNQIAAFPNWGYYGEPGGSEFDGTEYYFQMRVKMDPARITAGLNPGGNQFGKLCYFTRTDQSLTTQEINTESYQNGAAGRNYFSMYRSGSPPLEGDAPGQGNQPGNQNGIVWFDNRDGSAANAFYWPNPAQWVTVLYRIVPKLTYTTVVQVWIAREGETSYTKIWDMNTVKLDYGASRPFGHNAVLLTAYQNQLVANNGFYHRYTQLIFSKNMIPCPQV